MFTCWKKNQNNKCSNSTKIPSALSLLLHSPVPFLCSFSCIPCLLRRALLHRVSPTNSLCIDKYAATALPPPCRDSSSSPRRDILLSAVTDNQFRGAADLGRPTSIKPFITKSGFSHFSRRLRHPLLLPAPPSTPATDKKPSMQKPLEAPLAQTSQLSQSASIPIEIWVSMVVVGGGGWSVLWLFIINTSRNWVGVFDCGCLCLVLW